MYSLRIKYKNNCHVNLDFSRILVLFYYVENHTCVVVTILARYNFCCFSPIEMSKRRYSYFFSPSRLTLNGIFCLLRSTTATTYFH